MSAAEDYARTRELRGKRSMDKPKPKRIMLDAECMQCGHKWMIYTDEPEMERHCPKCGNSVKLTRS